MLQVSVRNAHGNLKARDKQYAAERLGHLDDHFAHVTKVEFVHREDKAGHHLEVTIFADKIVRAQCTGDNVRAVIEKCANKVEAQLRKNKSKTRRATTSGKAVSIKHANGIEHALDGIAEPEPMISDSHIAESRYYSLKPTTVAEAYEQVVSGDRDFYMFRDAESDDVCLVYRTAKGVIGLMCPEQ